jgi:ABC-type branched-subunit amino acid transport system substrate-binding protein
MIYPSIFSDDPFMNRYREMMKKYGGGKGPNEYGFMSYGITQMFEKALKESGKDLTREKLIDAIESWKNYDTGWLGVISYSPTDHEGQEGMVIGRMKGGEAEIIVPRYYPDPKP